jgi:hypothetical protein
VHHKYLYVTRTKVIWRTNHHLSFTGLECRKRSTRRAWNGSRSQVFGKKAIARYASAMKSISAFRYNRDIEDGYKAETTIKSQRSPRFNPSSDAEIRDGGFVWVEYSWS